jgi:hypothetical protein
MKKAVSIFLILLFAISIIIAFTGCMTQNRINKICAKCPKESFSKDSIVYKEKLVKVPVYLSDTNKAYIKSPCELLCDKNGDLKDIDTTVKTGKNKSVNLKNNKGNLEITCNADSLKKIIEQKNQIIERYKSEKVTVESKCELYHVKWYHNTALWISAIYLIGTALFMVNRFR